MLEVPQNLLVFLVDRFKRHFFKHYFSFFHNIKSLRFSFILKKKISLEITEREAFPRSVATSNAGLAIAP